MKLKLITPLIFFILLIITTACQPNPESEAGSADAAASLEEKNDIRSEREIPVEVLVLKKQELEQTIVLTDILQPIHSVDIVAEVSGKIISIKKKLGDAVTTRDTLAVVDDRIPLSNYKQALAQTLSTENNLTIARLNLESDRELYKHGDISEVAFQNSILAVKTAEANRLSALAGLSLSKKQYFDTRITSPLNGFISRKFIEPGKMVTPNMPLYHVVDLSKLKIEIGIPQDMIRHVQTGNRADVYISSLGDDPYPGTVRFISPQADSQSGSFPAEIHIKNTKNYTIRAGITAKVRLMLSDNEQKLAVPNHAVISSNGGKSVYHVKKKRAYLTPVEISSSFGSHSIIRSGISEGDTIVVVGMKNLGVDSRIWIESAH